MSLIRTKHWATREFDAHLRANAKTPFSWGSNDCCMYVANAIQSFTGVDIATDFRGKYADQESAMALIAKITGIADGTVADAVACCAQQHGLIEYAHPLCAQRGDLVVMQSGENLIAGIVHLNGAHLISVGEAGLVRLPITAVKRAWKV